MPGPDFFARLGLFVIRGFFSPEFCAELREEARSVAHQPTTVIDISDGECVDEKVRKSKEAKVA